MICVTILTYIVRCAKPKRPSPTSTIINSMFWLFFSAHFDRSYWHCSRITFTWNKKFPFNQPIERLTIIDINKCSLCAFGLPNCERVMKNGKREGKINEQQKPLASVSIEIKWFALNEYHWNVCICLCAKNKKLRAWHDVRKKNKMIIFWFYSASADSATKNFIFFFCFALCWPPN